MRTGIFPKKIWLLIYTSFLLVLLINHSNILPVLAQDSTAPVISILSPESTTYSTSSLNLIFTLSEEVSWVGYSLDGATNVTVYGNSTIIWSLGDGSHTLVVYATDASQNTGKSEIIQFSVDTRPPTVILWPPGNTTYPVSDIDVNTRLSEEVSWVGYSLDGTSNQTVEGNFTLYSLSDGSHNLVVYATDKLNHTGRSKMVYFSVDTTLPVVTVVSPKNSTYSGGIVDLNFTVGEEVSWVRYSLDGGRNQTLEGNVTLHSLSEGSHNVVIYATDAKKVNTGNSSLLFFTIDTIPPEVVIQSPVANTTYSKTNNITLSFTVNEEASLKYCLDGEDNVTLFDSIVLYNLTNGKHYLTIYSEDLYGNSGATGIINFTVDVERILQPLEIVIASVIILIGFSSVIVFGRQKK